MLRFASLALGLFSALLIFNPTGRTSGILLWFPRLIAAALAPWITLGGVLLSANGIRQRDPLAAGAGLAATLLAGAYSRRVLQSHDEFAAAFGPGWQARISPQLTQRMARRRWTPLLLPHRVRKTADVVFAVDPASGASLRCDLWHPPDGVQPSGLGVIYVHGGAWRLMKKDMFTRPMFYRLAGQGHLVMDIEYTLAPAGDLPGMVADVKRAIVWLKQHAAGYGVDPERIVLMGGSAGAHLALMAAYTARDPEFQLNGGEPTTDVRGVVSFYGPADLLAVYDDVEAARQRLQRRKRIWPYGYVLEQLLRVLGLLPSNESVERAGNFMADLVGADPVVDPDRYRRLSPLGHVSPHCPPTLLLQGTVDIFGLAPATRRLYCALRQASVPAILVEFPQTDHAFDLALPWVSPAAQAATYDVERFLALMV
jgi:acetyl esterase/lipase